MKTYFIVRTQSQYFGIGETLEMAVINSRKAGARTSDFLELNMIECEDTDAKPGVDDMGCIYYFGKMTRINNVPIKITLGKNKGG